MLTLELVVIMVMTYRYIKRQLSQSDTAATDAEDC